MHRNIEDDLVELNRLAVETLWTVAWSAIAPSELSPRMIFPDLLSKKERVSEQEARHIYCALVEKETPYYYALEAPTTNTFRFTGSTDLSARTDLALYECVDTKFKRIVNIEFKAHNPPEKSIKHDIEKLIREGLVGNWFHILRRADHRTFKTLFNKFASAIKDRIEKCATKDHESKLIFCFCVLKPKLYLLKRFDSIYHAQASMDEARELFDNGKSLDDVLQELATNKNWTHGSASSAPP
jgi:hypothetical protein